MSVDVAHSLFNSIQKPTSREFFPKPSHVSSHGTTPLRTGHAYLSLRGLLWRPEGSRSLDSRNLLEINLPCWVSVDRDDFARWTRTRNNFLCGRLGITTRAFSPSLFLLSTARFKSPSLSLLLAVWSAAGAHSKLVVHSGVFHVIFNKLAAAIMSPWNIY